MFAEPAPGLVTWPTMQVAYRRYSVRYAAVAWSIPFRMGLRHVAVDRELDTGDEPIR
jgi:hypothetical protein